MYTHRGFCVNLQHANLIIAELFKFNSCASAAIDVTTSASLRGFLRCCYEHCLHACAVFLQAMVDLTYAIYNHLVSSACYINKILSVLSLPMADSILIISAGFGVSRWERSY